MSDNDKNQIRRTVRAYRQNETVIEKLTQKLAATKQDLRDNLSQLSKLVPLAGPLVIRFGSKVIVINRPNLAAPVEISEASVA